MARRKSNEIELYDYFGGGKDILRYVDRRVSLPDPGVHRNFSKRETENDPLCQLWYSDLLTGEALEDAARVCPVKPEGWVAPARFFKPLAELDNPENRDYP